MNCEVLEESAMSMSPSPRELDDWLAAEAEVEQQLADARRRRGHVLMGERS
jgi:hypothetical protein